MQGHWSKLSLHKENLMRLAPTLMLLTLAVMWWSCSSSSPSNSPPGALAERPDPLREFAGTWQGTSFSTYAMATVKIRFEIQQNGNKFKGDYRCAPGNAVCTNNIQRGWVHGQIDARGFTVAMEDTSWCLFFMNEFYPPSAGGDYTCYEGGMVMDRGVFHLRGPGLSGY
jgi:hypothetical protein